MSPPSLFLGACRPLDASKAAALRMPAHHLVTHGVVMGMTGSGKTGLLTVLVEETLRAKVPVLVIDVKGDLPNLLLAFPSFASTHFSPWVGASRLPSDDRPLEEIAAELAAERQRGLSAWNIGEADLQSFHESTTVRVITPGSPSGELLHVLSSLERRSDRWDDDPEAARGALSAAVSLVLRLLGRDHDPAKSREHVLLSVFAELRLKAGQSADLPTLLEDLDCPPLDRIGALDMDEFLSKRERRDLAAALNTLLASPTFASWRQGASLDVAAWMAPSSERTPVTIFSVAHLDDAERSLVLGVLLEEVLSWVRSLPGSQRLRGLVVFDEVYGFLPPHPANPPTKRPLVALMKQGRAFGVGCVVATQNPMDLDYRALGNAGLWWIGRLQTDADRARVIDGLEMAQGGGGRARGGFAQELARTLGRLAPRWFVMRDVYLDGGALLLQPRWAMSYMRGPMTGRDIRLARSLRSVDSAGTELPLVSATSAVTPAQLSPNTETAASDASTTSPSNQ